MKMAIEKLKPSYKFNEEQINELQQIIPEAFKDELIDFNALYDGLSESISEEGFINEVYGINWPGKLLSKKCLFVPPKCSLIPIKEESVDFDKTRNILIEGENLEVLKLLQKSYFRKIKIIYIDPPYNTGKDLVYEDDYSETQEELLSRSGLIDEYGNRLTTNTKGEGRFHSKWLSMMYPRIRLARNLLRDDGVIFISIDDNELHNLKMICDEIFGEENFIEIFSWVKTETPANLSKKSKKIVEYVLCYQKIKDEEKFKGLKKDSPSSNGLLNQTNAVGILEFPANVVQTSIPNKAIKKGKFGTDRYDIELLEDTETRNGYFIKSVKLKAKFKWSQNKLENEISQGTKIFIPTEKFSPSYERADYDPEVPPNLINSKVNVGTNENASAELERIFKKKVFDFPKPPSLIRYLISFCRFDSDDIILDFFAGSGTTAHAVFEYNLQEQENRRYILVQLPEEISSKTDTGRNALSLGFKNIIDIIKKRLKYISQEYKSKNGDFDTGYKVFRLEKSNFKKWSNENSNLVELQDLFSQFEEVLINNWESDNLLIEIMLIEGFPLDSKVELIEDIYANTIQKVISDTCEHSLYVCLDSRINESTIKSLHLETNDIFICLDTSISDEDKLQLSDKGLIKTI